MKEIYFPCIFFFFFIEDTMYSSRSNKISRSFPFDWYLAYKGSFLYKLYPSFAMMKSFVI